jgi:hypothetical protein
MTWMSLLRASTGGGGRDGRSMTCLMLPLAKAQFRRHLYFVYCEQSKRWTCMAPCSPSAWFEKFKVDKDYWKTMGDMFSMWSLPRESFVMEKPRALLFIVCMETETACLVTNGFALLRLRTWRVSAPRPVAKRNDHMPMFDYARTRRIARYLELRRRALLDHSVIRFHKYILDLNTSQTILLLLTN